VYCESKPWLTSAGQASSVGSKSREQRVQCGEFIKNKCVFLLSNTSFSYSVSVYTCELEHLLGHTSECRLALHLSVITSRDILGASVSKGICITFVNGTVFCCRL
jgi:hypothetical protein